jgi:Rod binding domain-containing protein
MQIGSLENTPFPRPPGSPGPSPDARGSFDAILSRAARARGTPADRARDAAEQFVALTFVQPALKALRDTNQAAPPFAPSEGEKQFRALLDAELARRIVHKADYALVDRLARDLLKASPGLSGSAR